jgi:hypothetical protein
MAHFPNLSLLLCRNALVFWATCSLACSTQTVTLSRYVPSDVAMNDIASIAVAPWGGEAGPDSEALLGRALQGLDTFELIGAPLGPDQNDKPAIPGDMDSALGWGRHVRADSVLVGSLDLVEITVASSNSPSDADPPQDPAETIVTAQLVGYVALLDSNTGRTLLYEPVDHTYSAQLPASTDLLGDDDAWRLAALQHWAHTFAERLVPHTEGQDILLYSERSLPQSEAAIAALINQDWATAIALYRQAVDAMGRFTTPPWVRARAHYNLGITLASGGAVEEGVSHLERAQAIAPNPLFAACITNARAQPGRQRTKSRGHHVWQCSRGPDHTPRCSRARKP